MLSISQIGRRCGLSRSTLLYYDRLNLLRPSYRTGPGYRLYSAADEARLRRICRYRKAGLPLREIKSLLENSGRGEIVTGALRRRLTALNDEIAALRRQQHVVRRLLGRRGQAVDHLARTMTKAQWVALLRSGGMNEAEMRRWHMAFEAQSPLAHHDFLESLGISPAEIRRIRRWSRASGSRGSHRKAASSAAVGGPAV